MHGELIMKHLIPFALLLLVVTTIAGGCYYDKQEVLTPTAGAACDTSNVTFSKSVAPLLSLQCYGCHSNGSADAFGNGIRLEQYADVKANLERVLGAVTWQNGFSPMPKNGNQLSDCQIRTLLLWSQNGAKND
jgi:hypothetical protein